MDDLTLVAVVAVALFFDFTNGFHDTANSIATSVSTRALSPRLAVLMSAVLNFAGAFVSFKVAATIASGSGRLGRDHARHRPCRPRRRDHVEPDHVVHRPALELEPRAHRRGGRVRDRRRRPRRGPVARARRQGARSVAPRAVLRYCPRRGDHARAPVDHPQAPPRGGEPRLSAPAARLRRLRRLHPRDERRPEDDGDHLARPRRLGASRRGVLTPAQLGDLQRRDGDGHGHVRRRLADHQDPRHARREARPAAGLRRPDLVRDDPLADRPLRVPRLDDPHDLRLRARRRERRGGCRRCGGESRATSSSPG